MNDSNTTVHSDTIYLPGDTMNTIKQAAREGASDAKLMADRVWASTSLFLSRFVYTTTYTLSYGVVFPATLLARSVPRDNAMVRGLIDGAKAAGAKVDEIRGADQPVTHSLIIH